MAGWRSERTASSSLFRKTSSQTTLTAVSVQVVDVDAPMEAENALRIFSEQRQKDVEARKAMMEEVERVIKLIRDLRRNCDHYTSLIRTDTTKSSALRIKLDMITEVVTSIFAAIPKQYVPSPNGRGQDVVDDLDRLEAAITRMVGAVSETEGQLREMKQQVAKVNEEVGQARKMTKKFQRALDEAVCRLGDMVDKTDPRISLLDLIKAARKLLDDERKTTSDAEKALLLEKKRMDGMLDRRRELIKILRQLFERCGETDQLTRDLGLKSSVECPKEINEKKPMASEFERALSWLVQVTATVISELRTTKTRLSESEEKLSRSGRIAKDGAKQLNEYQDTIRKLKDKLTALNKKIGDAEERKHQAEAEADKMQEAYEEQRAKLVALHKQEKNQWQRMALDHNEHSKRLRQEMNRLRRDVSSLREQTSQLALRVERALSEYMGLKEKLDEGKNGLSQANRDKEANIRKLCADLAAMEAETKEVERESNEYLDDANETRQELDRRSGWQDGARNRFDHEKGQREKEEAELAKLRDEAACLQAKISSNERNLEQRNIRYRDVQEKLNKLCRRERELETETQELRWARDEQFPQSRNKERGPCPTCPANEEANAQLPTLRIEYEQLKKEKTELADLEAKLRHDIQQKRDEAVEKTKFKKSAPSSSEEPSSVRSSTKEKSDSRELSSAEGSSELQSKTTSSWSKQESFKQEAGTSRMEKVGRRTSGRSVDSPPRTAGQSGRKRQSRRPSGRERSSVTRTVKTSAKKQSVRRSSGRSSDESTKASSKAATTLTSQYSVETGASSGADEDSSEESVCVKITANVEVIEDDTSSTDGSCLTASEMGESGTDGGSKK